LTANRAKAPQKRPPSKDGRATDSARLSGSMFDDLLPVTVSNKVFLSSNTFTASVQLSAHKTNLKKSEFT